MRPSPPTAAVPPGNRPPDHRPPVLRRGAVGAEGPRRRPRRRPGHRRPAPRAHPPGTVLHRRPPHRLHPHRIAVEDDNGAVVEELLDPRASFAGHDLTTPWTRLQRAYFSGYAMWTYVTEPISLTF